MSTASDHFNLLINDLFIYKTIRVWLHEPIHNMLLLPQYFLGIVPHKEWKIYIAFLVAAMVAALISLPLFLAWNCIPLPLLENTGDCTCISSCGVGISPQRHHRNNALYLWVLNGLTFILWVIVISLQLYLRRGAKLRMRVFITERAYKMADVDSVTSWDTLKRELNIDKKRAQHASYAAILMVRHASPENFLFGTASWPGIHRTAVKALPAIITAVTAMMLFLLVFVVWATDCQNGVTIEGTDNTADGTCHIVYWVERALYTVLVAGLILKFTLWLGMYMIDLYKAHQDEKTMAREIREYKIK